MCDGVVKCLFTHWVGQVIDKLKKMNADHKFRRIRLRAAFAFTVVRSDQRFQILPRIDKVKISRNFVLLAPPSRGEVSANKSADE